MHINISYNFTMLDNIKFNILINKIDCRNVEMNMVLSGGIRSTIDKIHVLPHTIKKLIQD